MCIAGKRPADERMVNEMSTNVLNVSNGTVTRVQRHLLVPYNGKLDDNEQAVRCLSDGKRYTVNKRHLIDTQIATAYALELTCRALMNRR